MTSIGFTSYPRNRCHGMDRRNCIPCRFFETSKGCREGDKCPYLHETQAERDAAEKQHRENRERQQREQDQKLAEQQRRREAIRTRIEKQMSERVEAKLPQKKSPLMPGWIEENLFPQGTFLTQAMVNTAKLPLITFGETISGNFGIQAFVHRQMKEDQKTVLKSGYVTGSVARQNRELSGQKLYISGESKGLLKSRARRNAWVSMSLLHRVPGPGEV